MTFYLALTCVPDWYICSTSCMHDWKVISMSSHKLKTMSLCRSCSSSRDWCLILCLKTTEYAYTLLVLLILHTELMFSLSVLPKHVHLTIFFLYNVKKYIYINVKQFHTYLIIHFQVLACNAWSILEITEHISRRLWITEGKKKDKEDCGKMIAFFIWILI